MISLLLRANKRTKAKVFLIFLTAVLYAGIVTSQAFSAEEDLVVASFESLPNNLGGEIGVYGSLETDWQDTKTPFTWYYTFSTAGYDPKNVHGGKQSFRLVNGMGTKPEETWGSVGIDLGPVIDEKSTPEKIKSADVSNYSYLTFWLRGEKGGEHLEVLFRDANSTTYEPQVKYKVPDATTEWQEVVIPLDRLSKSVDLKTLVHIGFAFGNDVGNERGAIAYIDDIVFTNELFPH